MVAFLNQMFRTWHDLTHHHTELDKPGVVNIRLCYWRWPLRRIEWAWTSMRVHGGQGTYLIKGVSEDEFNKLFAVNSPREVHEWLTERKYEWLP